MAASPVLPLGLPCRWGGIRHAVRLELGSLEKRIDSVFPRRCQASAVTGRMGCGNFCQVIFVVHTDLGLPDDGIRPDYEGPHGSRG